MFKSVETAAADLIVGAAAWKEYREASARRAIAQFQRKMVPDYSFELMLSNVYWPNLNHQFLFRKYFDDIYLSLAQV